MYQAQTPKKQVDYTDFHKENTMINLRRGLKLSLIGIAIALIFLIGFLINAFLMDFNISKQSTYLIIAYLFLLIALVLIIASYSIIKKYFRLTYRSSEFCHSYHMLLSCFGRSLLPLLIHHLPI